MKHSVVSLKSTSILVWKRLGSRHLGDGHHYKEERVSKRASEAAGGPLEGAVRASEKVQSLGLGRAGKASGTAGRAFKGPEMA